MRQVLYLTLVSERQKPMFFQDLDALITQAPIWHIRCGELTQGNREVSVELTGRIEWEQC